MRIRNLTPFAQLVYANEDAHGRLFDILIVKASYCLGNGLRLVAAIEQEPLNFTDGCFGDFNVTSLRYPSDLVPYKPNTDVIVIADAFAPGGEPATAWEVRVQVGALDSRLSVTGPRRWEPAMSGWRLSEVEPVTRVPLRYEMTYGGEHPGPDDTIVTDERNPLGCGLIDRDHTPRNVPVAAPQVLSAGVTLSNPYRRLDPAGFGPIPPAWLPRRPLGGTYDDAWAETTWPHWAPDYDFAFHNSAARGMKYRGHMRGDERVVLTNLHPDRPEIAFDLPGDPVIVHLIDGNGNRRLVQPALDTLYIDVLDARPEDCLIALTWRMPFLEDQWAELEIDRQGNANPMRNWVEGGAIHPAAHPSDLFTDLSEPAHVD